MEAIKVAETVCDISLERISELIDIVGDIFQEGIESVLVVKLNLANDLMLLGFN